MDYLNELFQKWMPLNQRVATNSNPRLHDIFDTINSTLATPSPQTRLPQEFYDARGREIIDHITVEEEFSGYNESLEYRTVGIGGLLGEVVERMVCSVQDHKTHGQVISESNERDYRNSGEYLSNLKFVLSGCHDSTLAAILASLGTMEGENGSWPSYSSSLAVELFSEINSKQQRKPLSGITIWPFKKMDDLQQQGEGTPLEGLWGGISNQLKHTNTSAGHSTVPTSSRRILSEENMNVFYVRLRYNDRPIVIPGCKREGHHLDGDESFCTLVSVCCCYLASIESLVS